MNRRHWLLALAGLGLASAASLAAVGVTLVRAGREPPPLVVVRQQAVLHQGNGDRFPARLPAPLNPGVEGRLLFERDGWAQVELPGGVVGWLPRDRLLADDPQAR